LVFLPKRVPILYERSKSLDEPEILYLRECGTDANLRTGGPVPTVWWAEEAPGHEDNAAPVVDNGGCKPARLGTSKENSKTVDMPDEYKCPAVVSKANWDKYAAGWAANVDDSYSTSQSGGKLTVTRRNHNGGWGMNLEFQCCKAGATVQGSLAMADVQQNPPLVVSMFAALGFVFTLYGAFKHYTKE